MQTQMTQGNSRGAPAAAPSAWGVYFPSDAFSPQDRRARLIQELLAALGTEAGWQLLSRGMRAEQHLSACVVALDFEQLLQLCDSANLSAALEMQPSEGLTCLQAAVHEAVFVVHRTRAAVMLADMEAPSTVTVRLINYTPSDLHIRQLKSSTIGKLATLKGTVTRMSHVRPLMADMSFTCTKCGSSMKVEFPDGRFAPPTSCGGEGCRSRSFQPDPTNARCIDWQKLRLQELLGADQQQQGKVPRTVEVELRDDLVGSCVVGDVISVLGLVKVLATGDNKLSGPPGKSKGGQPKQNLFLIYVDALSVVNNKRAGRGQPQPQQQGQGQQQGQSEADQQQQQQFEQQLLLQRDLSAAAPNMPDFTLKDLQFILTFTEAYEGDQLRQLVAALCPTIYGNELVKAGLLLSMFGGVRKHSASTNRVAIRGDINCLLVGDPGLGKSQLLQAVSGAAPRGLYVCGNTSTSAGLTVSVVRDAVTGDCMFEAGAVVLADRGVCCVDEFDKMTGEHQALLEAMEQQEVSVAKAGLVASLPARTSIIAAANPVGGHFDRGKTVQENLKLSPAMLSRFDLIFVLLDRPDEMMDQALSEHIMALHSGLSDRATAARQRLLQHQHAQALSQAPSLSGLLFGSQPTQQQTQSGFGSAPDADGEQRLPLAVRLKVPADGAADGSLLPTQLLRKYIAYAREHVHPVLSDEAKDILQNFYLSLRSSSCGGISGSLPITARQLESLVRLAEARARAELRETVTADDAQDVIEIMREGMFDRAPLSGLAGGVPVLDFRKAPGSRGSKAGEAARFIAALRAMATQQDRDTFSAAELQDVVKQLQLNARDPRAFIDQLNEAGELLKKGPGQYRVPGVTLTQQQQQPTDSQGPADSGIHPNSSRRPPPAAAGGGGGGSAGGSQFKRPRHGGRMYNQQQQQSHLGAGSDDDFDVSNGHRHSGGSKMTASQQLEQQRAFAFM